MDSDLSLIVPCETIGIFLQRVELVCLLDVDLPQMRGRLDLRFAGKRRNKDECTDSRLSTVQACSWSLFSASSTWNRNLISLRKRDTASAKTS